MPEKDLIDGREQVRALVTRSAQLLDRGLYQDFVDLFSSDGTYVLAAKSDEVGTDMTWLEADRGELGALFREYPQHIRDNAHRTHLVAADEIEISEDAGRALSTFAVFRTDLSGHSTLYAVGHYEDDVVVEDGRWKLKRRKARLVTRQFSTPTPMPL
jgi:methanesulfonate monooxygenase subunit beta